MPALRYPRNRFGYQNDDAMERVLYNTIADITDYGTILEVGSYNMILGSYQDILTQMRAIQSTHRTTVNLGKQVVHAIVTFSDPEQRLIQRNHSIVSLFCRLASQYYGCLGYQNVYGIRKGFDGNIHVEFTINSVNFITRQKLICSNALNLMHEMYLCGIFNLVAAEQKRLAEELEGMEPAFYEIEGR